MRRGNQEPTFKTNIVYSYTDGPEVVEWFESIGQLFYPCQAYEMEVFCARGEDDGFAYRTICISKPRQNGKSYSARNYAVEKAAVEGMKVCYSAHHSRTTHKMFKEVLAIFEGNEELSALLADVSRARGFEGIWLTNGGCIEFFTRSTRSGGGRGTTYDIIIVDEAQEMTEDEQDALKPTQIASESGDPQMILIGTPPGPSCSGTVFKTLHDRAHENPETCGFAWMEWAVNEVPKMDGDRSHVLELAYQTNPAMGYRIRESVMLDVINTATSPDGFAREYLGWWSPASRTEHPIGRGLWERTAIDAIGGAYGSKTVLAVKFSMDGAIYALAGCKQDEDGGMAFEIVEMGTTERGTRDLASQLAKRSTVASCVVVDGMSGADALCDNLAELKCPKGYVVRPRAGDVVAAATGLLESLSAGNCSHTRQEVLDDSALNASRRQIGSRGGWGFGCDGDHDSTAIEAAALAVWGCRTSKRNPRRKQRLL